MARLACSYSPNYLLGSTSLPLSEFNDATIQIYDAEIGVVAVDVVVITVVSVDGKLPEHTDFVWFLAYSPNPTGLTGDI